jgi:hypothetical protein
MSQSVASATVMPSSPILSPAKLEGLISFAVGIAITLTLIYGWLHRADASINPENGIGYKLGIFGGSMMLLLLVYPFRKRIRFLKSIGSVGFWFRFHMLLGLLGPVAILYHSRFAWGALNSAVALGAMLIVSGSGLIGRFFYSRIHRGYSGRKLEVRSLLSEMHDLLESLSALGHDGDVVKKQLVPFEQQTVAAGSGFWPSAKAIYTIGLGSRVAQHRIRKQIMAAPAPVGVTPVGMHQTRVKLTAQSASYFDAVRRAAEFAFYDRMFRLWHLFHLPLFFILVGTAIIHIVAVHMY